MVSQGEIYWVDFEEPTGSTPGYRRPALIIQNNVFNASRLPTVLVCPITSNLRYAKEPGSILLDAREANLPVASVVQCTGLTAIDRAMIGERIGALSERRTRTVIEAVNLLIEPREVD